MALLLATRKPEAVVQVQDFLGHAWEIAGVMVADEDEVHIVITDTVDGELP
jgi:hypothetical protein